MFKRKGEAQTISGLWVSIAIAVAYGIFARIVFGLGSSGGLFGVLTWGFITLIPLAVGAASTFFLPMPKRITYGEAVRAALLSGVAVLGLALIFGLEVFICILMAAPIFLTVSVVGGLIMCWILRTRSRNYATLLLLFMLPYIVTPLESRFVAPNDFRRVDTQILINASTETIWQNIIRVPVITPQEQHFTFFHLVGVPKPIEAALAVSDERVGGIRRGSFDNGLLFIETITEWQPLVSISFTIHTEGGANVPAPFNEIGGRFFEILDASYRLEPVGDSQVILHLSSHHRLSTAFNLYGGLWTDWMLRDFQDYVLSIIKARCEA
jgi:hypothetical protein